MKKKVYVEYSDIISHYIDMVHESMDSKNSDMAKYYYDQLIILKKEIAFDKRLDGDSLCCLTATIVLSCAILKERYLELQRS